EGDRRRRVRVSREAVQGDRSRTGAPRGRRAPRRAAHGSPRGRRDAVASGRDLRSVAERERVADPGAENRGRRARGASRRRTRGPAVRVLVGEDETLIRLDLKAMLERAGFEVCAEARDGLEALELARSEQPDLAVLDVKMPRLDGIEAARRMLDE